MDLTKHSASEIEEYFRNYVISYRLSSCGNLFGESKNPCFVWEAIQFCEEMKLDYPNWVREYLKTASVNLLHNKDKSESEPDHITSALGLKKYGGGNAKLEQYKNERKRISAIIGVSSLRKRHFGKESKNKMNAEVEKLRNSALTNRQKKKWISFTEKFYEPMDMNGICEIVSNDLDVKSDTVKSWWYKKHKD